MKISGLYGITDNSYQTGLSLLEKARICIEAGIPILQYRHKEASPEQQYREALELAGLCSKTATCFIINDNVELAKSTGAHGVHLGQSDDSIQHARKILGDKAIIGKTCHGNIELAIQAEQQGADYVAFGRFFPSLTKPDAPGAELELISEARKSISLPIVAIGGINRDNLAQVLETGADAFAVIEDIMGQPDPGKSVREFKDIISGRRT